MLRQEPVVGLVFVERPNHVVAIAPDPLVQEVAYQISRVVSLIHVARSIEPVPAPPLAVVRGGQQAVNQPLVSIRSGVGYEFLDLLRGRGQAYQVVVGSPQERALRGVGRERETFSFELRQHEGIDRCAHAVRAFDVGHGRRNRLAERPELPIVVAHLGALGLGWGNGHFPALA